MTKETLNINNPSSTTYYRLLDEDTYEIVATHLRPHEVIEQMDRRGYLDFDEWLDNNYRPSKLFGKLPSDVRKEFYQDNLRRLKHGDFNEVVEKEPPRTYHYYYTVGKLHHLSLEEAVVETIACKLCRPLEDWMDDYCSSFEAMFSVDKEQMYADYHKYVEEFVMMRSHRNIKLEIVYDDDETTDTIYDDNEVDEDEQ